MPSTISSKQVLLYLNHLGYNNISAQQLKEFMQDLKKLIKHEEKRKFDEDLAHNHSTPVLNKPNELIIQEIFANLHAHGTAASKAKKVDIPTKKESVIKVQIKRSKPTIVHCTHEHDNKENNVEKDVKPLEKSVDTKSTEQQNQDKAKTTKKTGHSKSKTQLKPKASFIRPEIQTNLKSDPVALYHYYQAEWKRNKIPGEDNRADLRWAIREKMMGGSKA